MDRSTTARCPFCAEAVTAADAPDAQAAADAHLQIHVDEMVREVEHR